MSESETFYSKPYDPILQAFDELAEDLQIAIVSTPGCPLELFEKAIRSPYWEVRQAVVGNPTCYPAIFEIGFNDTSKEVVLSVVSNPNCPQILLEKGFLSMSEDLRRAVVSNLNCPPGVLTEAVKLLPPSKVLTHPNCSKELLVEMYEKYKTGSYHIRMLILKNPNCPSNIIREYWYSATGEGARDISGFVFSHPNCPVGILNLGMSMAWPFREKVVASSNVTPDLLEAGVFDEDHRVRKAAISNPKCSMDLRFRALKDQDSEVRLTALSSIITGIVRKHSQPF